MNLFSSFSCYFLMLFSSFGYIDQFFLKFKVFVCLSIFEFLLFRISVKSTVSFLIVVFYYFSFSLHYLMQIEIYYVFYLYFSFVVM